MKTGCLKDSVKEHLSRHAGFTLTELLVILAVIAVLVSLRLPALARASNQTKRAQCAANLRQFTLAMLIYGNEYGDKLPNNSAGNWATDVTWAIGSFVESTGCKWTVMYCPGTEPRFTQALNYQYYNYVPNNFRVLGYANTFPGSASVLSSDQNVTLTPKPFLVGFNKYVTPPASERVLLANATMSNSGQNNESLRDTYNYTSIATGYIVQRVSAHLNGKLPSGGNLGMLDGHVEWRRFEDMHVRTTGSSPVFWW